MAYDKPLGIELASVPVPTRQELLMLSLARTSDDGECLELGTWKVGPPGDDGEPALIAPRLPVLLAVSDLPKLQRLVAEALAALHNAELDDGWALLARSGDLCATLVAAMDRTLLFTFCWFDGQPDGAAYLPTTLAHMLPGMLAEGAEALAMRRSAKVH